MGAKAAMARRRGVCDLCLGQARTSQARQAGKKGELNEAGKRTEQIGSRNWKKHPIREDTKTGRPKMDAEKLSQAGRRHFLIDILSPDGLLSRSLRPVTWQHLGLQPRVQDRMCALPQHYPMFGPGNCRRTNVPASIGPLTVAAVSARAFTACVDQGRPSQVHSPRLCPPARGFASRLLSALSLV